MRSIRTFATLFTVAMFSTLNAITLIGNMPQANDDAISANLTVLRKKAMGFTTDNQAYLLERVDTRLFASTSATTPVLQVWSSMAGGPAGEMPGTMLEELGTQLTIQAGISTVFFLGGSLQLAPNTTYWLVMGTPAVSDSYDWRGSLPAITPTGFATHFGSLFTANGGSSWTNSSTLNSYMIEATVVPEPATLVVLGLSLLGVLFSRRLRPTKPRRR